MSFGKIAAIAAIFIAGYYAGKKYPEMMPG